MIDYYPIPDSRHSSKSSTMAKTIMIDTDPVIHKTAVEIESKIASLRIIRREEVKKVKEEKNKAAQWIAAKRVMQINGWIEALGWVLASRGPEPGSYGVVPGKGMHESGEGKQGRTRKHKEAA